MTLENGRPCGDCNASGWQHRAGDEVDGLAPPAEVRKLAEPSDPISKPLYDAIPDAG